MPAAKKAASKKTGRPSDYSSKTANEICARIAEGESLRSVCRDEGMPDKRTVLRWLDAHAEFRPQYARAMEARADYWADEIVTISDDSSQDVLVDPESGNERINSEFVARARLRVDTRKWLMARMAPKKYGDKITTEHTGEIKLSPTININAKSG